MDAIFKAAVQKAIDDENTQRIVDLIRAKYNTDGLGDYRNTNWDERHVQN
mgnify:FL=1